MQQHGCRQRGATDADRAGAEHGVGAALIRHHDRWARAFSRSGALGQPPQAEEGEVAERARSLRDHVIICGADEVGLLLSRTLRLAGVPHLLLESDRQRVEAGRAMGRRCRMAMPVGSTPWPPPDWPMPVWWC